MGPMEIYGNFLIPLLSYMQYLSMKTEEIITTSSAALGKITYDPKPAIICTHNSLRM